MNEYPEIGRAAMSLAEAVATDTSTVREGESKGLNRNEIRSLMERMGEFVPEDDEIPPVPPTGFMVAPGMRLLIVSWEEPPATDYVAQARVRTYRESSGELVLTQYVRGRSVTIPTLDPYEPDGATREEYNVEVALIDMWGRVGEAATTGPHMPDLTAADAVDLQKLAQLQLLQGLLPNENLATIEDAILLGNGVVQARSMTSMDAAAINLWVQNAAIEAAKVKSMAVDKLVGGVISTTTISVASRLNLTGSGTINAADLEIGASGITLGERANNVGYPSRTPGAWLTPPPTQALPSPFAGIGFFSDSDVDRRGLIINANGIAGASGWNGQIRIVATPGNEDITSGATAAINMMSSAGGGTIDLKLDVAVERNLDVLGTLRLASNTGGKIEPQGLISPISIPAGGRVNFSLSWSSITDYAHFQFREPSTGDWRPIVDNVSSMRLGLSGGGGFIQNNTGGARTVRAVFLK